MMSKTTAEEIIKILELEPLPVEGGWFRQTWAAAAGTAIYYLITPDAWSSLHMLSIPEIWHFYAGDAVRQLQLFPDGRALELILGPNITKDEQPQLVCPADVWQSTRLVSGGSWALMGTTMAPPYTEECISYPTTDGLLKSYEAYRPLIEEYI